MRNLAVDLRDGVRLTRLIEVVTGEWGLAVGLRVPAVSRLQASTPLSGFVSSRLVEPVDARLGAKLPWECISSGASVCP